MVEREIGGEGRLGEGLEWIIVYSTKAGGCKFPRNYVST